MNGKDGYRFQSKVCGEMIQVIFGKDGGPNRDLNETVGKVSLG